MARVLIVGCGCRGRALAEALAGDGLAVRGTTRDPARASAIEAVGAEAVVADPDRLGTVMTQLPGVTVVAWLLGSATGPTAADLHGPRLETFLERLVDTPVRGFVYEAAGTVGEDTLANGERLVREARERWRLPAAIVSEPPDEHRRGLRPRARPWPGCSGGAQPERRSGEHRTMPLDRRGDSEGDRGEHQRRRHRQEHGHGGRHDRGETLLGRRLRGDLLLHHPQRGRRDVLGRLAPEPGHQRVLGLNEPALVLHAAWTVGQVRVQHRGARGLQRAVEPIREMAFGAEAPAAALERADGAAQAVARGGQRFGEIAGGEAHGRGGLGARAPGEEDQRERAGGRLVEPGEDGGDPGLGVGWIHRTCRCEGRRAKR